MSRDLVIASVDARRGTVLLSGPDLYPLLDAAGARFVEPYGDARLKVNLDCLPDIEAACHAVGRPVRIQSRAVSR